MVEKCRSSGELQGIIYVSPTSLPKIGGAEVFLYEMCRSMGRNVKWIYVIVPSQYVTDSQNTLLYALGSSVKDPLPGSFSVFSVFRILRIWMTKQVDAVHFNTVFPGSVPSLVICQLLGIPTVLTLHGSDFQMIVRGAGMDSIIARFALRLSTVVTVVAEFQRKTLEDMMGVKSTVLPAGISSEFRSLPNEESAQSRRKIVLTVANERKEKGTGMLLELATGLGDMIPSGDYVELWMVGEIRHETKKYLESLSTERLVIRCTGRMERAEVQRIMHCSQVYVCTSREEGLSVSVLEALASGLAVVATDIPGNREVLADGMNAIIVPFGDAGGMARAVVRVLGDSELRETLSRRGRESVANRTWDCTSEIALSLYRQVRKPR